LLLLLTSISILLAFCIVAVGMVLRPWHERRRRYLQAHSRILFPGIDRRMFLLSASGLLLNLLESSENHQNIPQLPQAKRCVFLCCHNGIWGSL
jgi:hypothetical protein